MTAKERDVLERMNARYAAEAGALPSEADSAATEPTPQEEVKAVVSKLAEDAKKGNQNAKIILEGLMGAARLALKAYTGGAA
jgi:hypothetical protein